MAQGTPPTTKLGWDFAAEDGMQLGNLPLPGQRFKVMRHGYQVASGGSL